MPGHETAPSAALSSLTVQSLHTHSTHTEHGPAAVDQLSLAEALQAKHLAVGGQAGLGHDVGDDRGLALNVTLEVLGCVDVVLVNTDLHEVAGAREAQGIETTVAGQRAVQPLGTRGVGQPQGITVVLPVLWRRRRGNGREGVKQSARDEGEIVDQPSPCLIQALVLPSAVDSGV